MAGMEGFICDSSPTSSESISGRRRRRGQKSVLACTKICSFFLKGNCTRGTTCGFAHDEGQVQVRLDFHKTRLCSQFTDQGVCLKGAECSYAHGPEELRPSVIRSKGQFEASESSPSEDRFALRDGKQSAITRQHTTSSFPDEKESGADDLSIGERDMDDDQELDDMEISLKNTFIHFGASRRNGRRISTTPGRVEGVEEYLVLHPGLLSA
mmetsp:Transcript_64808/g.104715  ORF Transcript_64808/g.104715 Transcript_64808/m.104715 type:complete len:211 (-) Transcript_64808:18-650(-)